VSARRLPARSAAIAVALVALSACSSGRVAVDSGDPTQSSLTSSSTVTASSTAISPDTENTTTSLSSGAATTASATPTTANAAPTSTTAPPSDGKALAIELLALIVVQNERGAGYDRDLFAHWEDLDRDGCDTRQEVLARDSLTPVQIDPYRCRVVEGDWFSAYDGQSTSLPSDIDIDHVVALKEAWDSGAWEWSSTTRMLYANDLTDRRTLIAVSDNSNQSKSDKDPSNWMPPLRSDWCRYLGDWVSIKVRWNLSMDQSEFGRIRSLLDDECAGLRVVVPSPPPASTSGAGGGASGGGGAVTSTSVGADSGSGGDVYYANCTAARAAGAAPIYVGDPGYRRALDRDGDGIACEG
jgi:hypothetical protein